MRLHLASESAQADFGWPASGLNPRTPAPVFINGILGKVMRGSQVFAHQPAVRENYRPGWMGLW